SFFFSSRRRHTRFDCDWSSDVCSSDLGGGAAYKPTDYTQSLDPTGLRGARIGVARKFFGFNDQVDKLMADAIDLMKREGATVVRSEERRVGREGRMRVEVIGHWMTIA